MKKYVIIFASLAAPMLFSCNGSEQQKNEITKEDSVTTPPPVAQKPAFTPFDVLSITHQVKNFDKWLTQYKGGDSFRTANGVTQFAIGRGTPDSNMVTVFDKITDVAKAKAMANSSALKQRMAKAGVTGKTTFDFVHVIRFNDTIAAQTSDRVMVKHHVKDFDAWLKVFDGEGAATRASYGMVDRALSRGIDDSNMVYLVFAITDMAKAKARSTSPELKKLMQDAGVDSKPVVTFYKIADAAK